MPRKKKNNSTTLEKSEILQSDQNTEQIQTSTDDSTTTTITEETVETVEQVVTEETTENDEPEEEEDTRKYTANASLGNFFANRPTPPSNPEMNVEESWKEEDSLTLEQRRARYRSSKYYTLSDVPTWQEYGIANVSNEEKSEHAVNENLNNKISLWQGDITTLEIDAVVNAANETCLGGGGIDGVIHRAAGSKLYDECRTLHGCSTGQSKITRGYNLPSKYVIHTVGPVGENPELLRSCYETSLNLVIKHNIKTIALCGVSTGIFGYPLVNASKIAIETVRKWLETDNHADLVDRIIFCTYLDKELTCYKQLLPQYFPLARPAIDEDKLKQEETEKLKKQEEEVDRLKKQEEADRLKKEQEEADRIKRLEEERQRIEQEEEKKRQEEEERKRQEEEEKQRKEQEEADRIKRLEEERQRIAQEEEKKRQEAEEKVVQVEIQEQIKEIVTEEVNEIVKEAVEVEQVVQEFIDEEELRKTQEENTRRRLEEREKRQTNKKVSQRDEVERQQREENEKRTKEEALRRQQELKQKKLSKDGKKERKAPRIPTTVTTNLSTTFDVAQEKPVPAAAQKTEKPAEKPAKVAEKPKTTAPAPSVPKQDKEKSEKQVTSSEESVITTKYIVGGVLLLAAWTFSVVMKRK